MNSLFWAIVVLGVLIFVHEMGHFLFARWLGVRVITFSIGFGPKLFSWKGRGPEDEATEYQLSAIPLGGYVKMLGEDPEGGELTDRERAQAFSEKALWRRFSIVFAGPLFNFIFAVFALWLAFGLGVQERLAVVGTVHDDSPAMEAGLKPGDKITRIDEVAIDRWDQMSKLIRVSEGRALALEVEREQKLLRLSITPRIKEVKNLFGEPTKRALIGISPSKDAMAMTHYGVGEAFGLGVDKTWEMIALTFKSVWKLIMQVIPADQIGGPIMIAQMAGETAEHGLTSMLFFMSLISINLGILNLLPIPVLDGGHLMFYIMEAIKGGPVSEKAQAIAMRVGLSLLIALMLLAFYNDIVRVLGLRS
uniref:Zinc metalloprotease n=1 Tax=Magnetococcus massalia (strain MO-1) TaxID=451514 RepID=A0A1S7LE24_MAGMO|nr:Putative zinc metallopeptidaseRseP peptidase. Metallo peptidase. MEROPS family M50B [Candidatus Magnetococcus massalia]